MAKKPAGHDIKILGGKFAGDGMEHGFGPISGKGKTSSGSKGKTKRGGAQVSGHMNPWGYKEGKGKTKKK